MRVGSRAIISVAVAAAAGTLLLGACSSDDAAGEGDASSSDAASPGSSASGDTVLAGAAAAACAAYFELDLLNSTYAGGAVQDGDMTEAQARADFTRLLRIMVRQGEAAEEEGSLSPKFAANATRMRKAVKGLGRDESLSDLTKKEQASFALQSSRTQKACERAGFALPDDNIVARTAAGI
ncbi:MAG: hypothetical protein Q8M17_03395 [Actinomycetota bacterium]|nr:hypothetical protein [Actinomycetota bacterium]